MKNEKVELEIWFVLYKIEKLSRYHIEGNKLEYRMYHPANLEAEEMPFFVEEMKVLELLKQKGVIKHHDPPRGSLASAVLPEKLKINVHNKLITIEYLEIIRNKFNLLYEEYKKKYEAKWRELIKYRRANYTKKLKKLLNELIKDFEIKGKEKKLLDSIDDFRPHRLNEIASELKVGVDNLKHVKSRLMRKLKRSKFTIKTIRTESIDKRGNYQLKFIPE